MWLIGDYGDGMGGAAGWGCGDALLRGLGKEERSVGKVERGVGDWGVHGEGRWSGR